MILQQNFCQNRMKVIRCHRLSRPFKLTGSTFTCDTIIILLTSKLPVVSCFKDATKPIILEIYAVSSVLNHGRQRKVASEMNQGKISRTTIASSFFGKRSVVRYQQNHQPVAGRSVVTVFLAWRTFCLQIHNMIRDAGPDFSVVCSGSVGVTHTLHFLPGKIQLKCCFVQDKQTLALFRFCLGAKMRDMQEFSIFNAEVNLIMM